MVTCFLTMYEFDDEDDLDPRWNKLDPKTVADMVEERASTWKIGRGIPSMLGEKHLKIMLAFPLRLCPKRIRLCLPNYSQPSCCTWQKEMEISIHLRVSKRHE